MALQQVPTIPETITVHLGLPNQPAENVTVPFPDYIKNVASSEIYPTWPRQESYCMRPFFSHSSIEVGI